MDHCVWRQVLIVFCSLALLTGACGPTAASPGGSPTGPAPAIDLSTDPSSGGSTGSATAIVDLGQPAPVATPAEQAYVSDAYHVIEVTLPSGEVVVVENPSAGITLHTRHFVQDTYFSLIDSITRQSSGYLVTFNSGDTWPVETLAGTLQYTSDLGQVQLALETIAGMRTLKRHLYSDNGSPFSRGGMTHPVDVEFQDGSQQRIYVEDGGVQFEARFGDLLASIFLDRAQVEYNWTTNTLRTSHHTLGWLELPIVSVPAKQVNEYRICTDYGYVPSFNWETLAFSKPIEAPQSFSPVHSLSLADGTNLPVTLLVGTCPSGTYPCFKLDGQEVSSLNLSQAQLITPGAAPGSGIIQFVYGEQNKFEAEALALEWELGRLELPISASVFSEIVRAGAGAAPSAAPFHLLIQLANGEKMQADLNRMPGRVSTAPGGDSAVLELIEIPLSMGMWLVDRGFLEADVVDGQLYVLMFGQTYPLGDASNVQLHLTNAYGPISLSMDTISSVRPISAGQDPPETSNVRLTTRDGNTYSFPTERIQFVRYPGSLWDGTVYTLPLGPSFWHRFDHLQVDTAATIVEVDFARLRRLTLSGEYPAWTVELESARSGEILSGQVVPGAVADRGPGIASWDPEREGFWFAWQSDHAFLFVPTANVATIEIVP